jgi:D-amino-acid dehydrogenase
VGERAVVVGGGAIGVACAHQLAEAGFDVTILERGEIAGGCSYANAGLIVPGYSQALPAPGVIREGFRHLLRRDGPFTIRPRADPALARWLLRFRRSCTPERYRRATAALTELSRLSLEMFEALDDNGEVDFGYRRGALLNVYMSDGWRERARASCDQLHDLSGGGRLLEQDELLELEPALSPNVRGALLIEDQGSGDCFAYVRSLSDGLARRGVRIRTGTPTERVMVRGGRAAGVVIASGEEVPADLVVLAAGAWTPSLAAPLGLQLPIQAATGYSCTIPAWDGAPSSPILLDESHVVVLPLGDRVRFAGTLELAGFRTAPDARRYQAVVRAGRAAMRSSPPERGEAWFGFRPLMPDDLPAIGWVPGADGVIVAAGHGTLGFTQSPATGKLVAELASGTPPSVPLEPFRPDRFQRAA